MRQGRGILGEEADGGEPVRLYVWSSGSTKETSIEETSGDSESSEDTSESTEDAKDSEDTEDTATSVDAAGAAAAASESAKRSFCPDGPTAPLPQGP